MHTLNLVSLCCSHDEALHTWLFKMRPMMMLIRLRECAVWWESSLGANIRRYIFWCCSKNENHFLSLTTACKKCIYQLCVPILNYWKWHINLPCTCVHDVLSLLTLLNCWSHPTKFSHMGRKRKMSIHVPVFVLVRQSCPLFFFFFKYKCDLVNTVFVLSVWY